MGPKIDTATQQVQVHLTVVLFCVVAEDTRPSRKPLKKIAIVNLFGAVRSNVTDASGT